jgi:4-amino-4-deoxy-L-arabinose transferase-like glycosyltransferase
VAAVVIAAALAVRAWAVPTPLERLRHVGGGMYEGSWYFPRGGPYILGYEGGHGLWIDGQRLPVRPSPGDPATVSARRVYPAGVYAVRFAAGDRGRLLWHPPGRRGPLEYVPASSLAPEPPDQARVSRWAGASPADGALASLIAVALLAWLAFALRRSLAAVDRRLALAGAGVFVFALAVRLVELSAAGQTWDEDVNWSAGRNYIVNLLGLDFSAPSWRWNYEHPPVMKYIAGIGAQWTDGYGVARGLSAVMVGLACAGLVPIGARLFGRSVGVLAGVIAALSPHLIGHGKVVGHEAPSVLWWTVAVWLCLRAFDHQPDPRRLAARFAGIGVVLGIALASRFVNGLLAPLCGLILVISAPPGQRARAVGYGLVVIPATAVLVLVAVWPRLWVTPIDHLGEAWAVLRQPHGAEPYLGALVGTREQPAPWHYFAVYFAATAPLGVLAGAVLAALFGLGQLARGRPGGRSALVVLGWLVAPMLVVASPVKQDGVRYILPALLPLALAAAYGWHHLGLRLGRRGPTAVAGLMAAYLTVTAYRIHPYYLDYYGEHVGGPAAVAARGWFEIGWWGEGIDRAIAYLNRHADADDVVDKRRLQPSHLTWMRADLWARQVEDGPWPSNRADWVLVNGLAAAPFAPPSSSSLRLVYEVSAQGAPLARVYRRDWASAAPRQSRAEEPPREVRSRRNHGAARASGAR